MDTKLADDSGSTSSATHEFQTMKLASSSQGAVVATVTATGMTIPHTTTAATAGGTGRTEISHSELVKMLCYLEGELQARDVVIAALRSERVKQYITQLRTQRVSLNDPHAAIFRDKVVAAGSLISRESSTQAAQAEMEVRQIIEQQMEQQYQMVSKQRATHARMVNILTESLENNQRMLQELEEEKRKHEHDTAQGDDITYGLELERTKLRQELEEERAQVKKLEKELKKLQETLDFERNRQKQIVLLLIAERKKILMKYIEEGKRSEDLAQILAEEKQRSDTIADGLEEESKKSLRMEEELEKQAAAFDNERKTFKANLTKTEMRVKELEQDILLLQTENETLKKQHQQQQQQQQIVVSSSVGPAVKTNSLSLSNDACVTPTVNIAKIVQPTATVSSVPVLPATTGIARSITPGQSVRSSIATPLQTVTPVAAAAAVTTLPSLVANTTNAVTAASAIAVGGDSSVAVVAPLLVSSSSTSSSSAVSISPMQAKMQPTATIQRAPGGKFAALSAAAAHSLDQPTAHPVPIAVPPVTVPPTGARGAPPPIPPNKPVVPPKREPSLSRLGSFTVANAAAAAAAANAAAAAANSASKIN